MFSFDLCTHARYSHSHCTHPLLVGAHIALIHCVQVLGWKGGPAETLNGVTGEGKPTATFKGHIDTVFCVHLLVLAYFIAELAGENVLQSEGLLAGGAPVVNPHISEADLAVRATQSPNT